MKASNTQAVININVVGNAFKMKIHTPLLILAIAILMHSCGQVSSKSSDLLIEIPDTVKSETFALNRKIVSELNLESLQDGVDTFELRLGIRMPRTEYGQLIVIKKRDYEWRCFKYIYGYKYDSLENGKKRDYTNDFFIDTLMTYQVQPKSGWTKFLSDLEEKNIYNLPDQLDISTWDSLDVTFADGASVYTIEFANKKKYRFYKYLNPQELTKYFKECGDMASILETFDREVGTKDRFVN